MTRPVSDDREDILDTLRWLKRVTEDDTENVYGRAIHEIETLRRAAIASLEPEMERLVESAYREAWHEGYATGDAGGSYKAVEDDWVRSDARAALKEIDHG